MRYLKTDEGQQAFKQRSPTLSARQRSVFLLFDGQRTVADVLKATAGLGSTPDDVADLVNKGYLVAPGLPTQPPVTATEGEISATDVVDAEPTASNPQTLYQLAYPIATRLTAGLGLRGFKLNLAIEAASGYDDLVALLPRLTEALGPTAVRELKKALQVE